MSLTFGSFIKEKRVKKRYSLRDVSEKIGISNVYQSSIETGKRPAPSYEILSKLSGALQLNAEETGIMYDLAAKSKNTRSVAYDIADYINEKEIVHKALRCSMKYNIPDAEWIAFLNSVEKKYK